MQSMAFFSIGLLVTIYEKMLLVMSIECDDYRLSFKAGEAGDHSTRN